MGIPPLAPRWSWPKPRATGAVSLLRSGWGAPTSLFGHCIGRILTTTAPIKISGPAARGTLYRLPSWAPPMGAIALGSAILYHRNLVQGKPARAILLHELAHTRQHDILGPLYLPAHIVCQVASALLSLFRTERRFTIVHDFNPLEQWWICLGVSHIDTLAEGALLPTPEAETFFALFGLGKERWREIENALSTFDEGSTLG